MPYHVVTIRRWGEHAHSGSDHAVAKQRPALLIAAGAATAAVAVALVLTWALWPSPSPSGSLRPVSDVDASSRACLLEAPAGSPGAQPAQQGLTEAARARKDLLVQQFIVPANVKPASMMAELTALHCAAVVTVGSQAEAQVRARESSGTRFLVIGTPLPENQNVTVIPPASATAADVESALLSIVGS
jgi:hypothetical protein